jgi:hypothetical protein
MTVCRAFNLPDGSRAWYVEYAANQSADSESAVSGVVTARDDEVVVVFQTMAGTTDLALSQSELAAIVGDPVIGLSTTPDLNAAGEDIPDFVVGGLITNDSSSGSGTATAEPSAEAPQPQRSHRSN